MMKKIIAVFCSVLICLAAMSGCAGKPEVVTETVPTAEPTAAVEATAEPVAEPAETTAPAVPAGTELVDILQGIYDNYYPGTAGCSLKSAKYAATMLDWYFASGDAESVRSAAGSFAAGNDLGPDSEFTAKLLSIYGDAINLAFGRNVEILQDAGYTPTGAVWDAQGTNALFTAVYEGAGLELPLTFKVFYSDSNAERFLTAEIPTDDINEYAVFGALKTAGAVPNDTELLSFENNGETLALDLSGDYAFAVGAYGTSGEYMMLGSLVNTFLSAFGANSLTLTTDGAALETGHNVYDYALEMYPDNVGQ